MKLTYFGKFKRKYWQTQILKYLFIKSSRKTTNQKKSNWIFNKILTVYIIFDILLSRLAEPNPELGFSFLFKK